MVGEVCLAVRCLVYGWFFVWVGLYFGKRLLLFARFCCLYTKCFVCDFALGDVSLLFAGFAMLLLDWVVCVWGILYA